MPYAAQNWRYPSFKMGMRIPVAPEERRFTVFSYGSNSRCQLRARVKNPNLRTKAAILEGYTRIFQGYAYQWGGSIASLAKDSDGRTYGSVASLSKAEFDRLCTYEGLCKMVSVNITVIESSGTRHRREPTAEEVVSNVRAIAFVWPETPLGNNELFPSEHYLCSVYHHLRDHWRAEASSIPVCTADDDAVIKRGEWKHPLEDYSNCRTLEAIIVDSQAFGMHWVMPLDIRKFIEYFADFNIETVEELREALRDEDKCADLAIHPDIQFEGVEAIQTAIIDI